MRGTSLMLLSVIVLLALFSTKLVSQDEQAEATPKECAKDISSDTGVPVFFSRGSYSGIDLIWGLSTKSPDYEDSIPVILWVANPTDKPSFVATCPNLSYFWLNGIEVFDSSGHRIASRREIQDRKEDEFRDKIAICGRTLAIEIPPHSCKHTTFSKPDFDFYRDLSGLWDFQLRRYFITPAERTTDYMPIKRTEKPTISLEINIEKKIPDTFLDYQEYSDKNRIR